jgi:hypothetical protein
MMLVPDSENTAEVTQRAVAVPGVDLDFDHERGRPLLPRRRR